MLHRVGISIVLSWICLNAFAQLPHPNDTLDNGKKVPFNQFLGRFSVFNDLGGAAYYYSLNVGYSVFKSDLASVDLTLGANRIQYGQYHWKEGVVNGFFIPIGLSTYIGRRKNQFNLRFGYSPQIYSKLFSTKQLKDCNGCSLVEQRFFVSMGYTYQNPYGFFLGVNANLLLHIWSPAQRGFYPGPTGLQPWPGLVLGYRLPSKQRHTEWKERGFKRRVLRIEEKYDELDQIFYNDEPLEVDSLDMLEIEAKLAKLKKQHDRHLLEEQRLNGRSMVSFEGFGAGVFWSANYSYSFPIGRSNLLMGEVRGGFSYTSRADGREFAISAERQMIATPFWAGLKVAHRYRSAGVFLGSTPIFGTNERSVAAIIFAATNVEFHFARGITGGVVFYMMYDPSVYAFSNPWHPWGGVFLGYRLPQLKKV
jgi:hypothetical protein